MDSICFEYNINTSDYRKMIYFNTFNLKKYQGFLIVVIWIIGTIILMLDLLNVINLTYIMHLCSLIIAITVPVLLFYSEMMVRRFKRNKLNTFSSLKTTFNEDGIRIESDSTTGSGFSKWSEFIAVYEIKTMFILYRDSNRTILIPKENLSENKLIETRDFLKKRMNNCFIQRID